MRRSREVRTMLPKVAMLWFNFRRVLFPSSFSLSPHASLRPSLISAPCCSTVCMNATVLLLAASADASTVTRVAAIASRTVASTLSVTSASASANASSLPNNDISSSDGALAALLVVPVVFVPWLWVASSFPSPSLAS